MSRKELTEARLQVRKAGVNLGGVEALSAFPVESEVWLPPKLLLVPAVPPALSLALPRDPCIQPSHTEVSVSFLSPGLAWEGTQRPKGREAGTKPASTVPLPVSRAKSWGVWITNPGLGEGGQWDRGHEDVCQTSRVGHLWFGIKASPEDKTDYFSPYV